MLRYNELEKIVEKHSIKECKHGNIQPVGCNGCLVEMVEEIRTKQEPKQ